MKVLKQMKPALLLVASLLLDATTADAQVEQKRINKMNSFIDKGVAAPAQNFTGTVWVNMNVKPDEGYDVNIGTVTFEPKARTNWHTHASGQILFVIEGTGYYQEKGKSIQLIQKGDVVKIPKNAVHWHGASHGSLMRHIALVPDYEKDKTEWLNPVSDEDYNRYQASAIKGSSKLGITETAHKNHEELWPNYVSKAAQTDPELIQVFDNFAFDQVIAHDKMETKIRVLIIMASTIGSQALTEYKMFVEAALNVGVTPVEIKEVLYQSVPYVGISKVIDFIGATNEIFVAKNIELPLESQATTSPATRMEKGMAKQKEIVGNRVNEMYKSSPKDLLHIQEYLSANCFGDYITRNGLDVKTREMVTLSFLIALGGTESQIKGHISGNIKVGNNRQTLINLMTQLLPYVGYPRTLNAINCLNEILPAK
ncbi:4-carboxymuconolactone decarboxylase [Pedobacter yonginense]|uniref:4-carboxymuconolactone decarboxylase n=1 Tax=Pedobacter yonginense TaxID=651869 RepID=A0A317EL75_9SPHI|nr:carboxymuconolactone decarboxylase family protein [Pedobacter yonginense]PWS27531.1 4-carboxymuconolactone decarboxylase [Pedobacter yonginense]